MKKLSKRYTSYGTCYCDYTPLLLLDLILAKLAHVFQQLIVTDVTVAVIVRNFP
jgi:hypothetical protein